MKDKRKKWTRWAYVAIIGLSGAMIVVRPEGWTAVLDAGIIGYSIAMLISDHFISSLFELIDAIHEQNRRLISMNSGLLDEMRNRP